MGWRHKPVAIGDRFCRTGQVARVFVVVQLDSRAGLPPHARLQLEEDPCERITIALAALGDPAMFRRM